MNVVKATRRYEAWLGKRTPLRKADLKLKHQLMAEGPFPFLRATFYRWMQLWPTLGHQVARAPKILAVGDLHVENFGTWRDREGRLVWGVNDFDEAADLPYTVDLVRLATSSLLAAEQGHLHLNPREACRSILDGYRQSLAKHGRPFVLEEEHKWLRQIATGELRDPQHFWAKIEGLPGIEEKVPVSAQEALQHALPEPGLEYKLVRRMAGLGSLGHIRLVAIAEWRGGKIAREVKALAPSAADWVQGAAGPEEILYQPIITRACRCPDPFVQLRGRWLARRLSPHCCRVELSELPKNRDELRLLFAMGWETANIHLGNKREIREVSRHFAALKANWLVAAAKTMAEVVTRDWQAWRRAEKA